MNLKEQLKILKSKISILLKNNDYEYEAEFEDHPLGNQNIYRLHYISYHRFGIDYGSTESNVGKVDITYTPFMLPDGVSREDGFKILSYLTDYIENCLKLEPCSSKSVAYLNKALELERLGFKKLDIPIDNESSDIIDLFTVSGRVLFFKKSKYYEKYFDWYSEKITLEEVKNIYKKCGIEFFDLIVEDESYKNPQFVKRN